MRDEDVQVVGRGLGRFDFRRFSRNARLFFAFTFLYSSGLALYSVFYNLYLLRLGYREDFIGLMAAMVPLASGLCAIPIGMGSDRWGRRPFLICASIVLAASQVGLCLGGRSSTLLFLAFLSGVSPAMVYVTQVPLLSESSRQEERGILISLAFSVYIVTRMLMSLVGGHMPGWLAHWIGSTLENPEPFRYTLLLGVALTASSVIPAWKIREARVSRPPGPHSIEGVTALGLVPWAIMLTFMATSALRGISMGISSPFFSVYFQEKTHATPPDIGFIFFFAQLMSVPSAVVSPGLARRVGTVVSLLILRLIGGLALIFLGAGSGLFGAFWIFMVFSVVESLATPQEMTLSTINVPPAQWGRVQSLRVTGFQLAAAAGSAFAGRIILGFGYELAFAVAGLTLFGSSLLFLPVFGWGRSVGHQTADGD